MTEKTRTDCLSKLDLEPTADPLAPMGKVLYERYRCRRNFFDFVLNGQLSSDEGYFRFGLDTLCFGRSSLGARGAEYDALKDVVVNDGELRLPFDPTEIVDNLRLERYARSRSRTSEFAYFHLRRLYYLLRPLMTLPVRKQAQKFYARSGRKLSFPRWPLDTTVEDICERLLLLSMEAKGVRKAPFVWFWPDGATACQMMTHDVEGASGRDLCGDLMDLDDSYGIKASFQIIPEERYAVSRKLLASMRDRGFEIAIQDLNHDGRLFDNKEEFLRRAKNINRYAREYGATGFRAAILYRRPEWYDALEFSFDMSVPNVAHLDPQRGGCCTVMPYFIGNVLELPVTTVQDYTLFHILNEHSIELWKTQLDLIMHKHGLASFIIHPDYAMEDDTLRVYKDLLSYLRQLRERTPTWCALPSEVDSWWRARNRMSIVEEGNGWRIEGNESERAVIAYAKNVDGNLVYEVERPR
jgi:hypothetical protein